MPYRLNNIFNSSSPKYIFRLVCLTILILLCGCRDNTKNTPVKTIANQSPAQNYPRKPVFVGPVSDGVRSGLHWHATPETILADYGYEEVEYFVDGTASNLGREWGFLGSTTDAGPAPETTAPYRVVLVVHKPIDPGRYNGIVITEWANVSAQQNLIPLWDGAHQYLMRNGYAYIDISVQKQGIDGAPTAMAFWDPVRYGTLSHPGDNYAADIYAQIVSALRHADPAIFGLDPLASLEPEVFLGFGNSQSCSTMVPFINFVHSDYAFFDAILMNACNPAELDKSIVKVMWVNTGKEVIDGAEQAADEDLYVHWEISGAAHGNNDVLSYGLLNRVSHDTSSVYGMPAQPNSYDYATEYQYGEVGPGKCPASNFLPSRYVYGIAVQNTVTWAKSDLRPPSAERLVLADDLGFFVNDEDGNPIGGYRLPIIDVPVARYISDTTCTDGATLPLLPTRLAELYSSHADYVAQLQSATDQAVKNRFLLPEDACLLMRRAIASGIGGVDHVVENIPQCSELTFKEVSRP
jgi:hypothetical protein